MQVLLDGRDAASLARELAVPRVLLLARVPSTMDVAHAAAAEGASAGTLVVADTQTAGRGRGGRRWASAAGSGIWLTLIERPDDAEALSVLSLRLGLAAAPVLERWAGDRVQLKWPNDLMVRGRKLAGILVEARWRDSRAEWVAIGMGVNVAVPDDSAVAGLPGATTRAEVLAELVPAVRAAVRLRGLLTMSELEAWAARDFGAGKSCSAPVHGEVVGIDASGALLVAAAGEPAPRAFRDGSLLFEAHRS
ncbi:MAG TPA: biotin--[acetyl-CoA-carboxylase] ligase [Gemmatimonadaceae bacterium]|nr:biotin--[acetyl-CoA-carboxylase] ligase [Gemmatimonadaceae bacterium]